MSLPKKPTRRLTHLFPSKPYAWVDNAAANYSLRGAKLFYNGTNAPARPKSNADFNHVFEIRLGADCTNLAGVLRFHYNFTAPAA